MGGTLEMMPELVFVSFGGKPFFSGAPGLAAGAALPERDLDWLIRSVVLGGAPGLQRRATLKAGREGGNPNFPGWDGVNKRVGGWVGEGYLEWEEE